MFQFDEQIQVTDYAMHTGQRTHDPEHCGQGGAERFRKLSFFLQFS